MTPDKCLFRWAEGADVSRYDGPSKYYQSKEQYRDVVNANGHLTISRGNGYGYSAAFNAFGASFGASRTHSTDRTVTIQAGSGRMEHDIWGNNKAPMDGPQIMYSY